MAAPSALQFYAKNINALRLTDLASANLRLLLTTSVYVPSTVVTGHSVLADVTNELANGNGYTTGGALLTGTVPVSGTTGYALTSGNASWTASGTGIPAWRFAVLYYAGALWGVTSPLLGYFTGDSTPADVPLVASGNTLSIAVPTIGWFTDLRT